MYFIIETVPYKLAAYPHLSPLFEYNLKLINNDAMVKINKNEMLVQIHHESQWYDIHISQNYFLFKKTLQLQLNKS